MSPEEASAAVGRTRARANYATGDGRHAEGLVIGYSIVPMVCIQTDDGKQVWWRHDLTEIVETNPLCPPTEEVELTVTERCHCLSGGEQETCPIHKNGSMFT